MTILPIVFLTVLSLRLVVMMARGECQVVESFENNHEAHVAATTADVPCPDPLVEQQQRFQGTHFHAFPKMPARIRSLLRHDWNSMDDRGQEMMDHILQHTPACEFAHARSTFYTHLQGTFAILSAWNQPIEVRRAGLVHTAYSGDLFSFYLYDDSSTSAREHMRGLVGEAAEALVYLFGTVQRRELCNLHHVMNASQPALGINGPQTISQRDSPTGTAKVSPRDAANILIVTMADYLDQFVETNGWRDHHQIDHPDRLYPGDGRPAIALYWMSQVCQAIKHELEVVPPVFDQCRQTIDYSVEVEARDLYWNVITKEHDLTYEKKEMLLQESIAKNPFVGEPHIMLAQLHYSERLYDKAAVQARTGLQKLYDLAAAWDKRIPYEQWVGFGRIMLYRANRMLMQRNNGNTTTSTSSSGDSLPKDGRGLVPLQQLIAEMEELEE